MSLNLEKTPNFCGKVMGIKGQYLLLMTERYSTFEPMKGMW